MWWGDRLLGNTIVDELGVRLPVAVTEESPLFDAKVRREWQRLLVARHRPILIGWLSLFGLLLIGAVIEYFGVKVPWYLLLPLLAYSIWLGVRFQRVAREALRSSRLSRGLCPACVYGLAGVPARTDGLTICPECAAAWRVPASIPAETQHASQSR